MPLPQKSSGPSAPPGPSKVAVCVVSKTGAQTLVANTWTPIAFDTTLIDNMGMHNNAVNNTRLTAVVAGYYHVFGTLCTSSGSLYAVGIGKNGVISTDAYTNGTSVYFNGHVSFIVFLNIGDYVELWGYAQANNPIYLENSYNPNFCAAFISPS